jgi:hypothetical protein
MPLLNAIKTRFLVIGLSLVVPFPIILKAETNSVPTPSPALISLPLEQYPQLLVGKWAFLTFQYTFNKQHIVTFLNSYDPTHPNSGIWELNGTKLILRFPKEEGILTQTAVIDFKTPDSWTWKSDSGQIFDVERVSPGK